MVCDYVIFFFLLGLRRENGNTSSSYLTLSLALSPKEFFLCEGRGAASWSGGRCGNFRRILRLFWLSVSLMVSEESSRRPLGVPAGVLGVPVNIANWALTPAKLYSSGDANWSVEDRRRDLQQRNVDEGSWTRQLKPAYLHRERILNWATIS